MNSPWILDCTLRDGGYINSWRFGHSAISEIVSDLTTAGIDIVECGFLQDEQYDPDVSVFSCVSQIVPLVTPKKSGVLYVAMIALGDISPEKILPYDGTSIDGIRITFHKHEWQEAKETAEKLMQKGYKIFIQPVGTTSYSDEELLQLLYDVNMLQPFAFYLVDTLGILYRHDMYRFFYLIDHNLDPSIKIGFHSHNNLQLSFANAQELMRMESSRQIIIDSSVYGMGRGVGNLSTELLAEYININIGMKYSIIPLLSIADKYLMSIYAEQRWGYDLPYFLSAREKCHPNYASYLIKKETLNIEDISKVLSLLPADKRDLYHPELVEDLYLSMQNYQIDDNAAMTCLSGILKDREILLLAPGATLISEKQQVEQYIAEKNPYIIAVNFVPEHFDLDMLYVSNRKRLNTVSGKIGADMLVVATSNLRNDLPENTLFVNYASYLGEGKSADNAGAMLIRLLKKSGVTGIALAGFDGFDVNSASNYCVDSYKSILEKKAAEQKNEEIARQLWLALGDLPHEFITTTRYKA